MIWKLASCLCYALLFLYPNGPCALVTYASWFDWGANLHIIGRKLILLLQMEQQAAIEKSKGPVKQKM